MPVEKAGVQDRSGDVLAAHALDITLREAFWVWLRIAALSFGGPAGQIAVMHRILVEEKRWISEARFLHALNYCMLLPGPEAQQLATYIGWLLHRTAGGVMAGSLFILPGLIAMMALSWVYVLYGRLDAVAGLFLGLKAAVLAIVLQAVVHIGRRALPHSLHRLVAAAAFLAIFLLDTPFPIVIAAAALLGLLHAHLTAPAIEADARKAEPEAVGGGFGTIVRPAAACLVLWLAPVAALSAILGPETVFPQIASFFSKMAVVTFGGAYAVLAYVAQQAVDHYGWLRPGEMLDGLGLAETTPGPLIMVLQFVGFLAAYRDPGSLPPLLAGTLGGLLATWVTFLPCFLWIFLGAPFVERLRGNRLLANALAGITAAVVGVIVNLAAWFAVHTIFAQTRPIRAGWMRFDLPILASANSAALLLALAALVAVFRFKVGTLTVLSACAAAGLVLRLIETTG